MSDQANPNTGEIVTQTDDVIENETNVFNQVNETVGGINIENNQEVLEPNTTDNAIVENIEGQNTKNTLHQKNLKSNKKEIISHPIGRFRRKNKFPHTIIDAFGLSDPSSLEDLAREARQYNLRREA